MKMTQKQIESWYHSKIPRIAHGKQNPTKRFLTDEQVLELFSGRFVDIYEKVDGKLTSEVFDDEDYDNAKMLVRMIEDMSGKHTCHKHVMQYKNLPKDKRIILDKVIINKYDELEIWGCDVHELKICRLEFHNNRTNPSLKEIHTLLEALSKMKSRFGNDKIEGLVIKNMNKQLMGKWINDEFEDKIKDSDKKNIEFNEYEKSILNVLYRSARPLSTSEIAKYIKISTITAKKYLKKLLDRKYVRTKKERHAIFWRLK